MPAEPPGGGFDHFLPLLRTGLHFGAVGVGDVDGPLEFPDRIQPAAGIDDQKRGRQVGDDLAGRVFVGWQVLTGGGLWPTVP